ncbi:MAG: hypothetical protein E7556_07745 [Ruminococcaceae bacterium]|nr:hypothetical protein [Oscillospiraceae bacterium]
MKRVLSTILAIVMVLSVCSSLTFTASANVTEEEAKVNYEVKTTGLKNGEITFDVYFLPNQTITAATITVNFDPDIFDVLPAKTGPEMTTDTEGELIQKLPGLYDHDISVGGPSYYTFTYITSSEYKTGSSAKKFATLTLKVKSGKDGKVTAIKFYKGNCEDCINENLFQEYNNFVTLETPVMKNYWLEDGAIGFNWNSVTGAAGGYFVYKKVGNEFKTLAEGISATSFKDSDKLVNGTTYTYAIASRDGNFGYPSMKYEFSVTYVAPPTVTLSNATNGINVKWTKVSSADKYLIYRSTLQGDAWSSWETVGTANSTKLTYIDSTAQKGVTYRYAVSAVIDDVETGYKASASLECVSSELTLEIPVVKVANSAKGVKVTWNNIENAEKYVVYSSTYSTKNKKWSGWKKRGTTTSTSWTDTSVKSGTKYKYTVKAVNGDVLSKYKSSSSILYLAQPTVKIANASTGVKVTWNKITGATGYKVYRAEYKNGKWSSWKGMKTIDKGSTVSYTDKSAKSGVKYKYTVKAVNGKTASTYKSSSSLLYLAQPKVAVKALSNGIKVAWVQSTGATSYKIYRSEYNAKTKKWSSWKSLKTAKSTSKSYVDKSAKKGVKYRYTVKAVNGKTASTYKASSSVKR